jgi:hypothetical protein
MAPQERIGFGKGVRIGRDRQRVARGRDVNVTYDPCKTLRALEGTMMASTLSAPRVAVALVTHLSSTTTRLALGPATSLSEQF